jgi:hypothetical protein
MEKCSVLEVFKMLKKQAQTILKHYLKRKALFTISAHNPQEYYLASGPTSRSPNLKNDFDSRQVKKVILTQYHAAAESIDNNKMRFYSATLMVDNR